MKNGIIVLTAVAILAAAPVMRASDYEQNFNIGILDMMNVKMSASLAAPALPSTAPLTDRFYLDGYNRVDSSGDIGEGAPGLASRTAFFGYVNNSQVNLTAGTLALHNLLPPAGAYSTGTSTGTPLPELAYSLVRTVPGKAQIGLELRLGAFDLTRSSSGALNEPVTLVTDSYQLGGVVPPPAPYSGSFTVIPFTPRIGDTPARTTSVVQGTLTGTRHFSTSGALLRLGGLWRPFDGDRVALEVRGGPALLVGRAGFNVSESVATGSIPPLVDQGSGSETRNAAAFYAGIAARCHLSDRWDVALAVDGLDAGKFSVAGSAASATFDFSKVILGSLTIGRRF